MRIGRDGLTLAVALVLASLAGLQLAAAPPAGARSTEPPPPPAGYTLAWADEFDRDGPPDPAKWTFEQGLVRNEEAQWYQADNAAVRDGLLVIEARRERAKNTGYVAGSTNWQTRREYAEYTSASLSTQGRYQFRFGRVEMRGRIDTRLGLWPAFWTLGAEGEWPDGGEIDIMEFYRGFLLGNVAWGTDRRWVPKWDSVRRQVSTFGDPAWASTFHVWRMDWDERRIDLFVDGRLSNHTDVATTRNARTGDNPFLKPQFLLLSLAVEGFNGGDPSQTTFPARFEVDYVRVYQRR